MKKQEEGVWRGGMLADEMGMGKTQAFLALSKLTTVSRQSHFSSRSLATNRPLSLLRLSPSCSGSTKSRHTPKASRSAFGTGRAA